MYVFEDKVTKYESLRQVISFCADMFQVRTQTLDLLLQLLTFALTHLFSRTQRCPGGTIIQRTIDETMSKYIYAERNN